MIYRLPAGYEIFCQAANFRCEKKQCLCVCLIVIADNYSVLKITKIDLKMENRSLTEVCDAF